MRNKGGEEPAKNQQSHSLAFANSLHSRDVSQDAMPPWMDDNRTPKGNTNVSGLTKKPNRQTKETKDSEGDIEIEEERLGKGRTQDDRNMRQKETQIKSI